MYDELTPGANPNANPLCGKKIRARRVNENTGQMTSVDLTVVDRCEYHLISGGADLAADVNSGTGCEPTDIDVSSAVFDQLADHDLGRVTVTWAYL